MEYIVKLAKAIIDKLLKLSCWIALKAWPCLDPCVKIYDRCYYHRTRSSTRGRRTGSEYFDF